MATSEASISPAMPRQSVSATGGMISTRISAVM